MRWRVVLWLVVSITMVGLGGCQMPGASTRGAASVPSVEGTVWSGKDSDGDFYEYTFLKGGHLKYRTNTSRPKIVSFQDPTDTWTQQGRTVTIRINHYSTNVGTIEGQTLSGKAWNVTGKRWTWLVTKKSR